jgi:hypothetical protein
MEKQIYRLWGVIQPLVILAILLLALVIGGILWNVQQYIVNSLQGKIVNFNQEIDRTSSNNELFRIEDRLKLKKVVEILSAFIREKCPLDSINRVGVDVQAALTVLGN